MPPRTAAATSPDVTLGRILTLILGLFATCIAFYVSTLEGIIEAFVSIMSLFSAPILALFLLGMLTKKGRFGAWLIGTIVAVPATWCVQHFTPVNWTYYFPFSFLVTLGVACAGSMVFQRRSMPAGAD